MKTAAKPQPSPVLTPREAWRFLKISRTSFYRLTATGVIRPIRPYGPPRYDRDALLGRK